MKILQNLNLIILTLFIICILGCSDKTPEETEQMIQKSEVLKRVDLLCKNLPLPSDFKFAGKSLGGNTHVAAISYFYRKSQYSGVIGFYHNWSKENNWSFDENELVMRKNNQLIVLENYSGARFDFVINCKEKK